MLTPAGELPARQKAIEHLVMLRDAAKIIAGFPFNRPQDPEIQDTNLDEPTVPFVREDLEPIDIFGTSTETEDPFSFVSF
jgi:hypothetical protein